MKDDANVDVTHFILEGKVTVIQRLVVQRCKGRKDPAKTYYRLYKDQSANTDSKIDLKSIFMQTSHLRDGATFGLGTFSNLDIFRMSFYNSIIVTFFLNCSR